MKFLPILLTLVLIMPIASAYSFGDFFTDTECFFKEYASLTGAVIAKITTKVSDLGSEEFEEIHPSNESLTHDPKACRDTDGIDYLTRGDCISHTQKVRDHCDGNDEMVLEYYCGSTNTCQGQWHVCEKKCMNGHCV